MARDAGWWPEDKNLRPTTTLYTGEPVHAIVVLAIAKFHDLSLEELWFAYGMKKHYRLLPAHAIADSLGEEKARALPFFHTFSGCFTSLPFSSVLGRKRLGTPGEFSLILHTHLWSYPRWQHQSQRSESVSLKDSSFFFMTKHVNAHTWMKQERYFFVKGRQIYLIPPTKAPLKKHVKCTTYQAGHIWGQTLTAEQQLPNPGDRDGQRMSMMNGLTSRAS